MNVGNSAKTKIIILEQKTILNTDNEKKNMKWILNNKIPVNIGTYDWTVLCTNFWQIL